jgi:hypothetical protein
MKPDGGFLCIGCLENRLGRGLCCDDFKNVLVNDVTHWYNQWLMERGRFSPRLIDRLTTPCKPKSPPRVRRTLAPLRPGEGEPAAVVNGLQVIEEKPRVWWAGS